MLLRVISLTIFVLALSLSGVLAQGEAPVKKPADKKAEKKPAGAKAAKAKHYLLLFTDSARYAEGEKARYLTRASRYLAPKILGKDGKLSGETTNSHSKALRLIKSLKSAFAIVTPSFYLAYADSLKLKPILEARPDGKTYEEWAIYSDKRYTTLKSLKGKEIATLRKSESTYLQSVVLAGKLDAKLIGATSRRDVIESIKNERKDAPAALLARTRLVITTDLADEVEEENKDNKDGKANPLSAIWTSEKLSPMLLVTIGDGLSEKETRDLKTTFTGMADDKEAATFRATFGADRFGEVNTTRLDNAKRLQALAVAKKKKEKAEKR